MSQLSGKDDYAVYVDEVARIDAKLAQIDSIKTSKRRSLHQVSIFEL